MGRGGQSWRCRLCSRREEGRERGEWRRARRSHLCKTDPWCEEGDKVEFSWLTRICKGRRLLKAEILDKFKAIWTDSGKGGGCIANGRKEKRKRGDQCWKSHGAGLWCPSPLSLPFILSLSIKSRFQSFNFFPSWVMNLKISLLEGKLRAYKFSPQKVVVILILKNVSSCPLPEMCEIGVVAGTSERTTYFSTGKIKSYFCIMSCFSPKSAFRGQAVCDPRKKGSVRIHRRALNTLLLADGLQQHAQQDRNWRTELDSI